MKWWYFALWMCVTLLLLAAMFVNAYSAFSIHMPTGRLILFLAGNAVPIVVSILIGVAFADSAYNPETPE